jgi:site-specific recombinase XerD
MVYFKIILNDKRQKADNIYPVVVRVTFNRNNTTLSTGIRVKSDLWDETHSSVKPSHPNAQAYNKTIADYFSKVQNIAFQLVNDNGFSFESLRERLSAGYQAPKVTKSALFNVFAQQLIDDMIELNKSGNAMVYKVAVKRFSEHVCNPKLKFSEINYNLLEGFRRQLVKDGVKQNSISNYFRTLRAIYNKAIKAKLVDRSFYPFLDIRIKTERTAKRAITIDELVTLSKVQLKPKSQTWHSRNYFFLSFSLIGISFTDLAYLTPGNIKKGRLTYKRRKTGKELSIKLHPYTESLLSYYKGSNSKYLLPILPASIVEDSMKAKSHLMSRIKQVNKYLNRIVEICELDCDVTTYVARHSWATTAKRLGYSIELIAEALGHEYGNKITNIYLDSFDQVLIDEANAKVISCIE